MRLSFYQNETSAVADVRDLSKDELVKLLCYFDERRTKSGISWSPAELALCPDPCFNSRYSHKRQCKGGKPHRMERNVLRHHVIVFDIDHAREALAESIIEKVKSAGLECVVHSTHSHDPTAPAGCCLRVIVFPNRPVEAAEVRGVRDALVAALSIPVDPATKDLSRLYYLPAHKPGAVPFAIHVPGGAFDVDALGAQRAPAPMDPSDEAPPVTIEPSVTALAPVDIEELRAALKRVDKDEGKELAKRVLTGTALAPIGEQDNTLQRLAGLCSTWLPETTPYEAVLHLCESSLRKMDWQDGWEHLVATFQDKYERAVERTAEYRAERQEEENALLAAYRKTLAEKAPNPLAAETDDDGKYTPAALEQWEIGEREWIIQRGETYFVFCDGEYIARARAEIPNCYRRDLCRAPIDLLVTSKKGERDMTFTEVMDTYGSVAKRLESSLIIQRSYYDASTGIFHEAVCPRRHVVAKEHTEIQRWLELFGGDDAAKLIDWVATVARLDRQTCALYLYGPGGTGKTLLPQGLARIWTTGAPADMGLVLSNFNDTLCTCPLVFADEKLPNSKTISEDMRELIGSTVRPLTRKYMAPSSLVGAVRAVMSGNNPDLLRPQGDMSEFDLEAVSERFLFIEVPVQAKDYLLELGGPKVVDRWIKDDKLAEHALWLAETHAVADHGRFLVTGQRKRFHERLAVNSGVGSGVCEALVKCIAAKKPMPPNLKELLLVGSGEILVNVNAIEMLWPEHVKSADVPGVQRIAKALKAVSHEVLKVRVGGVQRNYARVRVDQLTSWAEENGVADAETLNARIAEKIAVVDEIIMRRDPIRARKPAEAAERAA